ncbi:cytochrome P450 [Trichophaea hybrida]|nr:cytochrome P450 [Trichophaea hybrida]
MHQLLGTNGIFTQSGSSWAASRALLRPSFDRAQVADLDRLEIFFERLRQRIEDDTSGCIELQNLLQKLTMDSSSDFLLGSPVGALASEESGSGVNVQNFTEAFDIAQTVIATRWVLSNLYWLYNPKYFQQACSVVHSQVQKYVNRALKLRSSAPTTTTTSPKKRYIFTEVLAETTQDPRIIQDQVLSVMLAGRDTTASLLSWTVLCLSRNPSVFQKLRAAISDTVGVDSSARIPTQAELRSITYLRWVLHEVLRLYPPLHANTRCPIKPTTLPFGGGPDGTAPIALRKGEKVVASFFGLHRRKDLYGTDADEFRPERWGEEKLRKIGWGWIPFNGGPRICLGQQMALTHASYFLTRLLQVYSVLEEEPGVKGLEVRYDTKITMYSGRGVRVRLG